MNQIALDNANIASRQVGVDVRLGQWYWVKYRDGEEVLACVMRIGSNFIGLSRPDPNGGTFEWRVHLDNFWREMRHEPRADALITGYQQDAQRESERLVAEVHRIMARLGMSNAAQIGGPAPAASEERGLVIAASGNAAEYRDALTLAKEKTLPDLFSQIETANKSMAMWAKAGVLGMEAEATALRRDRRSRVTH